MMLRTIRAHFRNGILMPMEKLELPEGAEVLITISRVPSGSKEEIEVFRRPARAWKDTVDCDALIRNIYADRLISTRPKPEL